MTLAVGSVLNNRYRIARLVGHGGFGAVYRAWDTALNRPVAVKENFDAGSESQRQFEREAQLLAGLRHPNLPVVIDHFILPGQGQYLVMDFVEGKSLRVLLDERGQPLEEAEVLPWIRQVCDALEYLHTRTPPVVHRDIKPDNIIVTGDGRAMLVDFGISKVYDDAGRSTTVGARAVTHGYSPPEQYGTARTDARSDVYSLGATLYTLLTGVVPPDGPDLSSGAEMLTSPRQTNPMVSEATSAAVMAAMAPNLNQRLGSAAGFAHLLSADVVSMLPASPVVSQSVAVTSAAPVGRGKQRGVPIWGWLLGVVALAALVAWAGMIFGWWGGETEEVGGGVDVTAQPTTASAALLPTVESSPVVTPPPEPTPAATKTLQPSPTATTPATSEPTGTLLPTSAPVWPVSETGVEACHLAANEVVTMDENARLWSQPDATIGTAVGSPASGQRATVLAGPVWGRIRRDIDFSGWWWEVETGTLHGWVWEDRLQECVQ